RPACGAGRWPGRRAGPGAGWRSRPAPAEASSSGREGRQEAQVTGPEVIVVRGRGYVGQARERDVVPEVAGRAGGLEPGVQEAAHHGRHPPRGQEPVPDAGPEPVTPETRVTQHAVPRPRVTVEVEQVAEPEPGQVAVRPPADRAGLPVDDTGHLVAVDQD